MPSQDFINGYQQGYCDKAANILSQYPLPVIVAVLSGTTVNLSVSNINGINTYIWTANPPSVSFSANAQSTVATLSKAGTYNFQVVIVGISGSITVNTSVTIQPVLTSITVSNVTNNTFSLTQQFVANALDQFGNPISSNFTWTAIGGTINTSGLFTASVPGTFSVTATNGSVSGTATIVINSVTPTPITPIIVIAPIPVVSPSVDANGWAVLPLASGANQIFTASNGVDTNPGTQSAPVSLTKAFSMVRNGMGDRIMLRAGDTYNVGNLPNATFSGVPGQPSGLFRYGNGPRPIVISQNSCFQMLYSGSVQNFAISGIQFVIKNRVPGTSGYTSASELARGMHVSATLTNFLVEDCLVDGFAQNITFETPVGTTSKNVVVRRSQVLDAWGWEEFSGQGIFTVNLNGLLIEECLFDHNGWNPLVTTANGGASPSCYSMYRHNMYLNENGTSNVVVRKNIISRAAGFGTQCRTNGEISDNLFYDNAVHASVGGATGQVLRNMIIGGHTTNDNPLNPINAGLNINSLESFLQDNVYYGHTTTTVGNQYQPIAIGTRAWTPAGLQRIELNHERMFKCINHGVVVGNPMQQLIIRNSTLIDIGGCIIAIGQTCPQVVVNNNKYHGTTTDTFRQAGNMNNITSSQWVSATGDNSVFGAVQYSDAWVSDAFLASCRAMDRSNWNSTYTAAGFIGANISNFPN